MFIKYNGEMVAKLEAWSAAPIQGAIIWNKWGYNSGKKAKKIGEQ